MDIYTVLAEIMVLMIQAVDTSLMWKFAITCSVSAMHAWCFIHTQLELSKKSEVYIQGVPESLGLSQAFRHWKSNFSIDLPGSNAICDHVISYLWHVYCWVLKLLKLLNQESGLIVLMHHHYLHHTNVMHLINLVYYITINYI